LHADLQGEELKRLRAENKRLRLETSPILEQLKVGFI
jgi:hypothetical protein